MPLAVSIELPPPIAIRLSKSPLRRDFATPVSMTAVVGSATVSGKTAHAIFAPIEQRGRPVEDAASSAINGSVTISGFAEPEPRQHAPAIRPSAPPPIAISRGVVIMRRHRTLLLCRRQHSEAAQSAANLSAYAVDGGIEPFEIAEVRRQFGKPAAPVEAFRRRASPAASAADPAAADRRGSPRPTNCPSPALRSSATTKTSAR